MRTTPSVCMRSVAAPLTRVLASGLAVFALLSGSAAYGAAPTKPNVSLPLPNAPDVSLNPTIVGGLYNDADGDPHASSDWEIGLDLLFTVRVAYSLADADNLTSIVINAANVTFEGALEGETSLAPGTDYYARVRYRDSTGAVSTWSGGRSFTTTTSTSQPPAVPLITYPGQDQTGVSVNPTITTTAFSDPDGDAHASSDWEIHSKSNLRSLVASSLVDTSNLTSIVVNVSNATFEGVLLGQSSLEPGTDYWVIVRHRDDTGAESVSEFVKFTTSTGAGSAPAQPSMVSPPSDATGVSRNPTVVASAYSDADAHASSDWEIYNNVTLSQLGASSYGDTTNLETIAVDDADMTFEGLLAGEIALAPSHEYWLRVRYWDGTGLESNWSAARHFTTGLGQPPVAPVISNPAADATGVLRNPTIDASAFADPETDAHASSDWKVFANAALSIRVASSLLDAANLESIDVAGANVTFEGPLAGLTQLAAQTEYWVVVTYRDSAGATSSSAARHFTTIGNQPPDVPVISSPATDETDVSRNLVITTNAFSDPDGDPHGSTDWEIFSDVGLTQRVASSMDDAGNLTSITINDANVTFEVPLDGLVALAPATDYYVRVTHTDIYGASASEDVHFVTAANNPPAEPTITSPLQGALSVSRNPTVLSTAFSDPDLDLHASSDWRMYEDSGLTQLVASSMGDAANLTSITFNDANVTFAGSLSTETQLALDTVYYVLVTYTDTYGGAAVANNVSFRTTDGLGNVPDQPTVTTPVEDDTGVDRTPDIVCSIFNDADGGTTHASTDWELFRDAGLSILVAFSMADGTNLESIALDSTQLMFVEQLSGKIALAPGTEYWLRVRYRDDTGLESPWSVERHFETALGSAPSQPSILSPVQDELDVDHNPVLTASAFADVELDAHVSSDWEIYGDLALTSLIASSMADAANLTSIVVDNANMGVAALDPDTEFWARVTYRDASGLTATSAAVHFTTVVDNRNPGTPSITYPTADATGVIRKVTIAASDFSDLDGDSHDSSDWEIFGDAAHTVRIAHSLLDTVNLTSMPATAAQLTFDPPYVNLNTLNALSDYYVRVRYHDDRGAASAWSAFLYFVTGDNISPLKPLVLTPVDDATDVSRNPSSSASGYLDPEDDAHASSDWELYADSGLSLRVAVSLSDGANLTTLTWDDTQVDFVGPLGGRAKLAPDTQYYMRARYRDAKGAVSAWALERRFTTEANQPPAQPSITLPTADETGVSRLPTIEGSDISDPDGDAHGSSDWEIFEDGSLLARVVSSVNDGVNLTSIAIDPLSVAFEGSLDGMRNLDPSTEYWAVVTYSDEYDGVSPASTAVHFTTAANLTPDAPALAYPAMGEEDVALLPTLLTAAYSDPDLDAHAATTWELSEEDTFAELVASSSSDALNLTSIEINPTAMTFSGALLGRAELERGTDYWLRVSFTDSQGATSPWTTVSFTTVNPPDGEDWLFYGSGCEVDARTSSASTAAGAALCALAAACVLVAQARRRAREA